MFRSLGEAWKFADKLSKEGGKENSSRAELYAYGRNGLRKDGKTPKQCGKFLRVSDPNPTTASYKNSKRGSFIVMMLLTLMFVFMQDAKSMNDLKGKVLRTEAFGLTDHDDDTNPMGMFGAIAGMPREGENLPPKKLVVFFAKGQARTEEEGYGVKEAYDTFLTETHRKFCSDSPQFPDTKHLASFVVNKTYPLVFCEPNKYDCVKTFTETFQKLGFGENDYYVTAAELPKSFDADNDRFVRALGRVVGRYAQVATCMAHYPERAQSFRATVQSEGSFPDHVKNVKEKNYDPTTAPSSLPTTTVPKSVMQTVKPPTSIVKSTTSVVTPPTVNPKPIRIGTGSKKDENADVVDSGDSKPPPSADEGPAAAAEQKPKVKKAKSDRARRFPQRETPEEAAARRRWDRNFVIVLASIMGSALALGTLAYLIASTNPSFAVEGLDDDVDYLSSNRTDDHNDDISPSVFQTQAHSRETDY